MVFIDNGRYRRDRVTIENPPQTEGWFLITAGPYAEILIIIHVLGTNVESIMAAYQFF